MAALPKQAAKVKKSSSRYPKRARRKHTHSGWRKWSSCCRHSSDSSSGSEGPATPTDVSLTTPRTWNEAPTQADAQTADETQWGIVADDDGDAYAVGADGQPKRLPEFRELPHAQKVIIARGRVAREPHMISANTYYVRTAVHVREMVDALAQLPSGNEPWISFDLEANGLGHGSPPALMQLCDHKQQITYLVDLGVLTVAEAWDTAIANGTTLRSIFEDDNRLKLIFDCRQDSCCLYDQAGIKLEGILDLQLLHILSLNGISTRRQNLEDAVRVMAGLSDPDFDAWKANKDSLKDLTDHDWMSRPLDARHKAYAAGDVELLYTMYLYAKKYLTDTGMRWGREFSKREFQSTWVTKAAWDDLKARLAHPSDIRPDFKMCWDDPNDQPRKYAAPRRPHRIANDRDEEAAY